jgi:DNA-binding MarR family transcriptional regulator
MDRESVTFGCVSIQKGPMIERALMHLAAKAPERLTLQQALFFVMIATRDVQTWPRIHRGLTVAEARRIAPIGPGLRRSYRSLVEAGLIRRENSVEERDARFALTEAGWALWNQMRGISGRPG